MAIEIPLKPLKESKTLKVPREILLQGYKIQLASCLQQEEVQIYSILHVYQL